MTGAELRDLRIRLKLKVGDVARYLGFPAWAIRDMERGVLPIKKVTEMALQHIACIHKLPRKRKRGARERRLAARRGAFTRRLKRSRKHGDGTKPLTVREANALKFHMAGRATQAKRTPEERRAFSMKGVAARHGKKQLQRAIETDSEPPLNDPDIVT